MKKTILFNLLMILSLASCSDDNSNELEKDTEQHYLFLEVFGNKYYSEEQNSTIEFFDYYQYPNKDEFETVCVMYGDIIQNWHKDTVGIVLTGKGNIISNNSNIEFKIIDKNLLIGSSRVEGNWVKK